jgi:hypothetical protein
MTTATINECLQQLDAITESNKKIIGKNIQLKEKLGRQNAQKELLYNEKKQKKSN